MTNTVDTPEVPENESHELVQDELASLQDRAVKLGIKFRTNMGVEKLRKLIKDKLEGSESPETPEAAEPEEGELTKGQKRKLMKDKATKLVRVRITCMNPNKKDWPGEIFTVSNSLISVKKYIPFDAEDGWHIPQIMLNMLKERKCQVFIKKRAENGQPVTVGKLINEFAIEELEPLSEAELEELARKQAMSGSIES